MTRPSAESAARRAALAAELRRLQRKGHSQRALAERFGVNRRTVSALLAGPTARASVVGKRAAPVMAPFEHAVLHLLQAGVRSPAEVRRRLIAEYGLSAGTAPNTVRDFVNRRLGAVSPLRPSTGVRFGDTASGAVEWYTPPELFAALTDDDGVPIHFDVDVAAPGVDGIVTSPHIAVPASRFITKDLDALEPATPWGSRTKCWMNPPYGPLLPRFTHRATSHAAAGGEVLALLPARTDTRWWHSTVMTHADAVVFIRSRLRFIDATGRRGESPAFGQVLVAYGPTFADVLERATTGPAALGSFIRLRGSGTPTRSQEEEAA
ncbi:hypothetical protein HQQ88_04860 [Curtobacterium sp. VKM Ac-2861]|uniref:DNA N-6-adenine-methyltransferase n=1 Tax=Curtobacterium sp. VKM Ac-2861 TaxID=2739016 RepID=UPI001566971B|nr:hypothetical protein [Curtobacterium sp. VKM Ac-2861]